jgi:predicted transcriptional regulator
MASQSTTSIKLDSGMKTRLQNIASDQKRSAHWVMQEAIELYVVREEKASALRREAVKAWEDYQESGLHLTLEEADKWLAELEAGNDIEPPACHT